MPELHAQSGKSNKYRTVRSNRAATGEENCYSACVRCEACPPRVGQIALIEGSSNGKGDEEPSRAAVVYAATVPAET